MPLGCESPLWTQAGKFLHVYARDARFIYCFLLIHTSLTMSNVEHFLNSIQKLAICMTSLENVYSGPLPMFLIRLFFDIELYEFF